jgi:hypothetical protein
MREPFAFEVYQRFLRGESIHQLSFDLDIPETRIEQRIRAVALLLDAKRDAVLADGPAIAAANPIPC